MISGLGGISGVSDLCLKGLMIVCAYKHALNQIKSLVWDEINLSILSCFLSFFLWFIAFASLWCSLNFESTS